jgi:hypothetical protein
VYAVAADSDTLTFLLNLIARLDVRDGYVCIQREAPFCILKMNVHAVFINVQVALQH